ncbi:hypothetical protein SAMN05216215_104269 [Saccharopolyspora shandongensis]|uniref:Alpha-amylase n=2 Tax=Saccharopolyspora shandongensis TaxID=418495 RepID=A0A1H3PK09_9PSEU|nr:hypothetical protein SAMN05216215_104269 [Saccharopolyspora shandongensis]
MRKSTAMAVLTALALTGLPAVANAAAEPAVDWANSVTGDLGTLQVAARADAGIDSLRAYIVSYATGQDVAVIDDLTLHSGTTTNGVWRTPQPLQLDQLGSYRVDVEATDTVGGFAPRRQAGRLTYLVDTELTLTADTTTVTYSRRTIRASGVLTGRWPDTREVKPVVGGTISVSNGWGGWSTNATTSADGSYRTAVEADNSAFYEGMAFVDATYASEGPYLRATADPLQVTATPVKSRITAQVSERRIDRGASVVLSGKLTWRSPELGWQPLADTGLGVGFCVTEDYCTTSVGYPTTDAEGRFELTVTPWETGFYRIGYGSPDVFVSDAVGQADIVVYQPVEFTDFTAARDPSGAVNASGHLQFDGHTPWPIPVQVQFRASGTKAWTTVATAPNAEWDGTGYFFSATVADRPAGEWRAFYEGQEKQFRPTYSTTVLVS